MLPKALDELDEGDLRTLIANGVSESKVLEYKQQLPGTSDADRKEFLADVSAFANTGGGDLLYGITEAQGVPTVLVGVTAADFDLELQRLDSVIADGLDPRIRYSHAVIPLSTGHPVLAFRIERSWIGPHRVIYKGHDKFYGRNATRKYPLDVSELRLAFTLGATVAQRLRAFRTDRVIALSNNQTPIPFVTTPKLILHCLPLASFVGAANFDVIEFNRFPNLLPPMHVGGWNHRVTFDGVVTYSGGQEANRYTQLFRNGVIEAVHGSMIGHEHQGRRYIPSTAYDLNPAHSTRCKRCFRPNSRAFEILLVF